MTRRQRKPVWRIHTSRHLLYRSSGHLSALAGSDCDLEQAEASLLGGLELATIAGRQRTAEHCRGSLQQVQQGRPLSELPL